LTHIKLTDRNTGAILVMPKAALCLWAHSPTDVEVTPLGLAAYMQKVGENATSEPYFVRVKETLSEIEEMLSW
jgi:hypothetical protein